MYAAESVKFIVSCFADINVIIKGKLIINSYTKNFFVAAVF